MLGDGVGCQPDRGGASLFSTTANEAVVALVRPDPVPEVLCLGDHADRAVAASHGDGRAARFVPALSSVLERMRFQDGIVGVLQERGEGQVNQWTNPLWKLFVKLVKLRRSPIRASNGHLPLPHFVESGVAGDNQIIVAEEIRVARVDVL